MITYLSLFGMKTMKTRKIFIYRSFFPEFFFIGNKLKKQFIYAVHLFFVTHESIFDTGVFRDNNKFF